MVNMKLSQSGLLGPPHVAEAVGSSGPPDQLISGAVDETVPLGGVAAEDCLAAARRATERKTLGNGRFIWESPRRNERSDEQRTAGCQCMAI